MAASLAHELNQPLGAAMNYLNAARFALGGGAPDAQERALTRIQKAIDQMVRATAILKRIRNFVSHGEADKRIVNASVLVQEAIALAMIDVRDPQLRLRTSGWSQEPLLILADGIQIQQVVFNLVRNAIEATEGSEQREIVVTTKRTSTEEVELSVADTGPGLPDQKEALFRPFATTKHNGLGLGLSICRTIIEAHGGRLWAESRPEGGAAFHFTVPAVDGGDTSAD